MEIFWIWIGMIVVGSVLLIGKSIAKNWFKARPITIKDVTNWKVFEKDFVPQRMSKNGFKRIKPGPGTKDGGIDITASTSRFLFWKTTIIVQCKFVKDPIGPDIIQQLAFVKIRKKAKKAYIATTCRLTSGAQKLANDEGIGVRLFEK